jgi:hypothetical protein
MLKVVATRNTEQIESVLPNREYDRNEHVDPNFA